MDEIVVFCNQNDRLASSLFSKLLHRGKLISIVTAEELVFAQWKHTIDATGRCKTQLILPNGSIINSSKLKAAFNRVRFLPTVQFANKTDRNYAGMEMFAVFVSFLKGINHLLINPVQANHFITNEENELLLKMQAVEAGLPVTDYHFTSSPRWQYTRDRIPVTPQKSHFLSSKKKLPNLVWENKPVLFKESFNKATRITIVGKTIFGDGLNKYTAPINKLRELIGTPFFELMMVQTSSGPKLDAVNTFPIFGDSQVIDALASLIEDKISSHS